MSWPLAKLGEVCQVTPGFAFKSNDFSAEGIAVVKIASIKDDGTVDVSDAQRWPNELFTDKLGKFLLHDGDIVLAMTGATAGKIGRIRSTEPLLLNQRVAKLQPVEIDPDFLWLMLKSEAYRELFFSIAGGAAQPNISGGQIEAVKVPRPLRTVQESVAKIISAYDDLIENNRRRMALLEESARLLYREWFVRLRFPGHEHTRVIDGVPDGWERKMLGEVAQINQSNLGSTFDGEIEYIDIASVTPNSINETTQYSFRDAPSRARRVVRHGDIIWSCVRPNRRSHAVIWQPLENLVASTGFAVISPVSVPTSFLYQAVTTDAFVGYLENRAKGAAYPAVVAGDFQRAEVLVPSGTLLMTFNGFAEPLLSQTYNLHIQNQKLRTARNLLLPRLMSGEITV